MRLQNNLFLDKKYNIKLKSCMNLKKQIYINL